VNFVNAFRSPVGSKSRAFQPFSPRIGFGNRAIFEASVNLPPIASRGGVTHEMASVDFVIFSLDFRLRTAVAARANVALDAPPRGSSPYTRTREG